MNNETIFNVYEALENMKEWKPIYEALLRTCATKEQAIEALRYLIKLEEEWKYL